MRRIVFALFILVLLVSGCGRGSSGLTKGGGPRAFPVQVETIQGEPVEYVVSATGSVEPFEEVVVSARVQGVVEHVNFREGDHVTPETVLIEIEPRRFQYQYDAAVAAHERAQAELKEARDGLLRRENPDRPGIFSREEIEAWRTRVAVAQANEREKAADVAQAALDLEHSKPHPPIEGVVQSRHVSTGQFVNPGSIIAVMLRRDPMLLRFAVPEAQATQLQPGLTARFTVRGAERQYAARLIHVSSAADRATRMVSVTAEVTGDDAAQVTPGAFARITIPTGGREAAPTVPETAVRPSERGFLVYVVEEDGKAYSRVIETGLRTGAGRIEVRNGLEIGEQIVIRGAEALRDGVDVRIVGGEPADDSAAAEVRRP
jgi:membrane fusion protein, multidrug efflux system